MDNFKKKRQRLIQARHRRKIKAILIEYKGGKCQFCGYNKCQTSLHFHHIDSSLKDFSISKNGMGEIEKLKREIDKCILVCSNCHGEIHDKEYIENITNLEKETNVHSRPYGARTCITCKCTFKHEKNSDKKCNKCRRTKPQIKIKKIKPPKRTIDWPSIEQLSILVFTKPLTSLAKEFGISDRAIKKRCVKFGITTPPAGYWLRNPNTHL